MWSPMRNLVVAVAVIVIGLSVVPENVHAKGQGKDKSAQAGKSRGKDRSAKARASKSKKDDGSETHAGSEHADDDSHRGKWAGLWRAGALIDAGFERDDLLQLLGSGGEKHAGAAKPLPPGIRKNLARGKPLPPGIAKRYPQPEVAARLPRVVDHEWVEVGKDLVLIEAGTAIIRHILEDILG